MLEIVLHCLDSKVPLNSPRVSGQGCRSHFDLWSKWWPLNLWISYFFFFFFHLTFFFPPTGYLSFSFYELQQNVCSKGLLFIDHFFMLWFAVNHESANYFFLGESVSFNEHIILSDEVMEGLTAFHLWKKSPLLRCTCVYGTVYCGW